jgi:hypothetical protein
MPAEQLQACLAGKMCGARKKHSSLDGHLYCRQKPSPGQVGGVPHRCRRHGGNGAPPLGNKNAVKHGIYCDALFPGEEAYYAAAAVGDVEHEIRITKVRLRRALFGERRQQELLAAQDPEQQKQAMVLNSTDTDSERVGDSLARIVSTKVIRKATDFHRVVHDLVTQIVKLEGQRALMSGGSNLDAEEKARRAREYLAKMNAELDSEEGEPKPA